MKAIIIFLLFGLSFSYDQKKASDYAKQYCNRYNPEFNNYKNTEEGGEDINFVSQCLKMGGLSFDGCEGRDDKGMFRTASALKNCLISKGWKQSTNCKMGYPMFRRSSSQAMIIAHAIQDVIGYCSHTPDRCDGFIITKIVNFFECYSP